MVKSDIFNITDKLRFDEEIKKYKEYEFTLSVNSNLNSGEISIYVKNSDSLFHPHESYLEIEGRLVKADGSAYANADAITLTHNGLVHLFDRIEYKFYDSVVESVNFPGKATTMLGMLKYPNEFQQSKAMNQLWFKDTTSTADLVNNAGFSARQQYIIQKPTTKGSFGLNIPLRHIFGFCDDYEKVFYGLKHELFLLRASDDNAIFKAAGVAAGKVNITRISLMMRRATPSAVADLELTKIIKSQETLDLGFRSRYLDKMNVPQNTSFDWRLGVRTTEKPRYILVSFQTNRERNQEQNSSIFDHCDLKNMWIELNEERNPATNYSLSFPNMKVTRAYRHASNFAEDYYNMTNLISLCGITPSDNKDLYPIMYFNVSKQSERMKDSIVDIRLKAEFNTPVPAEKVKKEKVKKPKKEKPIKEKKRAGRPRIHPIKEKKERDPKYDRLVTIRTNPTTIKLTNAETGEFKTYNSKYDYIRKEKHGHIYLKKYNGKVKNGVKIELIRTGS
ncbi:uncharacterized protein LOC136095232 [Hydra vulgaris]|uniref:uncharacterized protein LOC136095232 n=1 Tax=Hydra vulgaris TaxID=6087 RepID=UPI0032EA4636